MNTSDKSDRELLELAARAAGVPGYYHDGHQGILAASFVWNPLRHDGDALRLAVKLEIRVWPCIGSPIASAAVEKGDWLDEPHGNDPAAATRRAIVRAAAAIGAAQ